MRTGLVLGLLVMAILPLQAAELPIEQVNVSGARNLKGVWTIQLPASAELRHHADVISSVGEINDDDRVLTDHSLRFAAPRQQICRIGGDDTLTVRCISFGRADDGVVEAHGDSLTLVWRDSAQVRLVLRGSLKSADTFTASFTLEQERERNSDPDKMTGTKVDLIRTTDEAGIGFMLQGALAAVSMGDMSLLSPGAPDVALPQDLAALGRVQAVYYVGQAPLLRDPKAQPLLDVYAVEFTGGERLCGVHLAYGKVDGLRCV